MLIVQVFILIVKAYLHVVKAYLHVFLFQKLQMNCTSIWRLVRMQNVLWADIYQVLVM